jgi:Domain of Unknown Function (DUF1080)
MKTALLARTMLALLAATACAAQEKPRTPDSPARQSGSPEANQITEAERAAGWRLLFDGKTTTGWRGYKTTAIPAGWRVVDGILNKAVGTGDILTADQFGDFELTFDWKLAPGGNAGVFYRGTEEYDHIYWSAPEFQLLDDARHADGASRLTSAGAAYALYPSPAGIVKPGGEWNSARILVRGAHVEHWLNGTKLLEYELWSPDWTAKVKASKFIDYPNYGRAKRGYIGIQGDHDGELSLRNVKIREAK